MESDNPQGWPLEDQACFPWQCGDRTAHEGALALFSWASAPLVRGGCGPLRGGLDACLQEAQGSVRYKSSLWMVVSPEDADALSPEPTGPSGKLVCEAPLSQGDVVLEGWGACPVTSRGKRGVFGPGHRGRTCDKGQRQGGVPNCPPHPQPAHVTTSDL